MPGSEALVVLVQTLEIWGKWDIGRTDSISNKV